MLNRITKSVLIFMLPHLLSSHSCLYTSVCGVLLLSSPCEAGITVVHRIWSLLSWLMEVYASQPVVVGGTV